jgi:predicted RNA-binding Zn ribbon-like protein
MQAPLVADHLALDLLNTQARVDGAVHEFWTSAQDVLGWLAAQGIVPAPDAGAVDGDLLLVQALALRALARQLLTQRKHGETVETAGLNAWLHASLSAPHLERDSHGQLTLTRPARGDAIASLLGPVAEQVAALLVEGDFALVRQCEHPDCVLWFYDRTKAHKRRWCSMALCGNRYKAAQFRKTRALQRAGTEAAV